MQDRRDSRKGDEGCWKWQMQDRRKQESRDAGKTDAELVGCRPEGMQDRNQEGCWRRGIKEMRDGGEEGCGTG